MRKIILSLLAIIALIIATGLLGSYELSEISETNFILLEVIDIVIGIICAKGAGLFDEGDI